ncbi:MAG: ATP-dependent helicase, partial [Eggerthellaceae bacterium]|nr:ATP-dependent helicase [Eggerthellaceae bacterium]
MEETLENKLQQLNSDQQEAVNHIDGPLLVVAGPGTGKTQILTLRAANILKERDINPENILCLTYTDAGAIAMKRRLVQLVGKSAYGVKVSTFHAFASDLKKQYPQYFENRPNSSVITSLAASKIINKILSDLPQDSPLFASGYPHYFLNDAKRFFSDFRSSGLSIEQFKKINAQNLAFFDYAESYKNGELVALMSQQNLRGEKKEEAFTRAIELIDEIFINTPADLRKDFAPGIGVYKPFAAFFSSSAARIESHDESGKPTGFTTLRDTFFKKDAKTCSYVFKDKKVAERSLVAIEVYEKYIHQLKEKGLFDFDDMIVDALHAIENHSELQNELHEQYQYIQVDEFQDTNSAQLRLVELITQGSDAPNVMVVGDDDQAIMRFQGASVETILQFQERFKPHEVVLKTNYRSTPAIVSLGQEVAEQIVTRLNGQGIDKNIHAFKKDNAQITFSEDFFETKEEQYFTLAKDIRERIDAGAFQNAQDKNTAIAVIGRKHKSLQDFIPYLKHFEIPFSYKMSSDVSQVESMQTLLSEIRCVVALASGNEKVAQVELPKIIAGKEFGLQPDFILDFALNANRKHKRNWIDAMKASCNKKVSEIWENLHEFAAVADSAPAHEIIFELSKPLRRYYKNLQESNPLSLLEFNAGIRALLNFAKDESKLALAEKRTLRLTDVAKLYNEADIHSVNIDATVRLPGGSEAIQLVSAHSSKGLEYDCVYLLDADEDTWHKGRSATKVITKNLFIGSESSKGDLEKDDIRRLLFVAITRARDYLKIYRSGKVAVNELQGIINSNERECDAQEYADVLQIDWTQSYEVPVAYAQTLLAPDIANLRLSASALNTYVEYVEGCTNTTDFVNKNILRLPEASSSALDFGNTVHKFMERYVNEVVNAHTNSRDALIQDAQEKILLMDCSQDERNTLQQRFDHIVTTFLPWFDKNIAKNIANTNKCLRTEEHVETVFQGVPIHGYCDLLEIDKDEK